MKSRDDARLFWKGEVQMIDIIVLALVLGYCAFIIIHRYREAKLAARMGKIMSCAGYTACTCADCGSRQGE